MQTLAKILISLLLTAAPLAAQSLFFGASAPTNVCGPPTYNCTRSDLNVVYLPVTLPDVGGLTGAGTQVLDSLGNGNKIVRLTDAVFDPALPNKEFVTASSGSGDMNLFSRVINGHYLLCLQNSGTGSYAVDIDAVTKQPTRPYASTFPGTGGIQMNNGTCTWGFTSNKAYFTTSKLLTSWDFTDWLSGPRTTPPTLANEFDYTELTAGLPDFNNGNCLPASYASPTWKDDASSSRDDQTFASAFSIAGGQGTGVKAAAYRVGSGCVTLDTTTGAVTGDWGTTGTATLPVASFAIHNQKLSKDGKYLIITCTDTGLGCPGSPYFWQLGTLSVTTSGADDGGHYTEGYTTWINGNNTPVAQAKTRKYTAPSAGAPVFSGAQLPPGAAYPFDMHAGYNNADPRDTYPVFMTAYQPYTTGPFKGAVAGTVNVSGTAVTWVSGHKFDTGWTGTIVVAGGTYPIASVGSTTALTLSVPVNSPISGTTYTYSATGYYAWSGEIVGFSPITGVAHRFANCFASGGLSNEHVFDAVFCIGSVSQDGKLFAFTSNWLGTLGSNAGASTCDTATNCRSDVYVVSLDDFPPINYYVGPGGNDSNNCLTVITQCLTLAHTLSVSIPGGTFNLAPGTYRTTGTSPHSTSAGRLLAKSGQTFLGPYCVPTSAPCSPVVSGSILLTGASGPDGNGNYSYSGQTQAGTVTAYGCDTGWDGCNYPEDVFLDGAPLQHIISGPVGLTATQWYFDYPGNTIYIHTNPSGHTVETSVLDTVFSPNGVNNITLQNLTLQHFAAPLQGGGIDPYKGNNNLEPSTGANWRVINSYVTGMHSAGIKAGYGLQVLNSVVTANGQSGIGGMAPAQGTATGANILPSGIVLQGNRVTLNNFSHVSPGFGAGGIKLGGTANAVVRGNYVGLNLGHGIHFDVNSINPLIDGNVIDSNLDPQATGGSGSGLVFEVSELGATFRNNVLIYSGINGAVGMFSSTSGGVQAYCNTIYSLPGTPSNILSVAAASRGNFTQQPFSGAQITSNGNYFHHNTVIWGAGAVGSVGYFQADPGGQPNFLANNTPPDYNTYHAPTLTAAKFSYGASSVPFAAYQALGADQHGSLDTVNTSGYPTVLIIAPGDNYINPAGNTFNIRATASDAGSITKAELYKDWTLSQTITGIGPYSFSVSGLSAGQHILAVMGYAASGVRTCNAITVNQN